jgi:uncharacterized membrane protein (DUF441 family)
MQDLGKYLVKTLHHKRLGNSTSAIAGLASGLSVLCGLIAAHFAPRGISRLTMALHIAKKPLILKLAPLLAGVAVAFATAAGIVRFYSWCKEREEEESERDSQV